MLSLIKLVPPKTVKVMDPLAFAAACEPSKIIVLLVKLAIAKDICWGTPVTVLNPQLFAVVQSQVLLALIP
jgi:hypothetical protein